ncbi:MAG: CPBP family intramembrane metalloprotease, partial [Planctomycetota bacterium]
LCFFFFFLAPLIEEIFFRAFLYPPLRQKMGKGLAMMAVSLLFAFLHPGFYSILPIFVLAMALVILFEKTQNIWPCVFLHFLNNSLTMVKVILLREFLG